jgi:hypothetical protein
MDTLETIKAGFTTLKVERGQHVQAHGIPDPLLRSAEKSVENLSLELKTKLEKAHALHTRGMSVFYLTGDESPDKDIFAVLMLMLMLGTGKVVRYYIASSFDTHEHGCMAVMGVDAAKGLAATKLLAVLNTHVHNYKVAILGGESLASLEAVVGKTLFDYMAHLAVEVKIPSTRDSILEV